ncbi:sensor histidine kinase [Leptospira levettii]|uniref:GAF domain-containing sensor histidine kinase n=1 Tax=Leptospira levettii TaxID=2023178 RepID=UPI001EEAE96B|nr:ATP-binding protein [Leptospira levettii]MCG6149346.1 sensor histidine kinase [Leptospira levettii]
MLRGQLLSNIIEAVSNTYGKEFLNRLTEKMSTVIGADYTFIALFDKEKYESKTVALVAKGSLVDNMAYSLEGTPCADVFDNNVCYYPTDVQKLFPNDLLLVEMKIKGYIGTPLVNSKQETMGLIVGLYESEIRENEKDQVITLFQIFSGRIAAELERLDYESQLEQYNRKLESLVKERTIALENTLTELHERQNQLIESEKLASLGLLSAGIAHEINNPLNFILGGYHGIKDYISESSEQFGKVKFYLEAIKEGVDRTSKIVKGLNQYTRVGESNSEEINIHETLDHCLVMLAHTLRDGIKVVQKFEAMNPVILGSSTKIHQCFFNILTNAIQSMDGMQGELQIYTISKENQIKIDIIDTGVGILPEYKYKIMTPFFTTKEPGKGVGLGLSIAYKIIQDHHGSIQFESELGIGTKFMIEFPCFC